MNSFNSSRQRRRVRALRAVLALLALAMGNSLLWATEAVKPNAASGAAAVPDTIQQRVKACTTCHGVQGEGSAETGMFPRLAGKPAAYLAQQLQYFQDGLRKYSPMEYTVRQLDPAYMREIAEYFSAQEVPYHRAPVPTVTAAELQRGEKLALHGDVSRGIPSCVSCHGSKLTGVEPLMPGLMGLSYDYISSQIGAWRTHTRAAEAPDCMAVVANRLRDSDITAVSAWLASREPPTDMHAEPASDKPEELPGWCVVGVKGVVP
ncbi:MAG: c-type cytochrome [Rhodanobacter sp.]